MLPGLDSLRYFFLCLVETKSHFTPISNTVSKIKTLTLDRNQTLQGQQSKSLYNSLSTKPGLDLVQWDGVGAEEHHHVFGANTWRAWVTVKGRRCGVRDEADSSGKGKGEGRLSRVQARDSRNLLHGRASATFSMGIIHQDPGLPSRLKTISPNPYIENKMLSKTFIFVPNAIDPEVDGTVIVWKEDALGIPEPLAPERPTSHSAFYGI